MFGYPASSGHADIFAGPHEDRLVLRLGEEHVLRLGTPAFEPLPGQPMRAWCAVPADNGRQRSGLRKQGKEIEALHP